jgi:hypothetical protein
VGTFGWLLPVGARLPTLLRLSKQTKIWRLLGKLHWEGDLHAMRSDEGRTTAAKGSINCAAASNSR